MTPEGKAPHESGAIESFEVLITAQEAFPAFERAFLSAKREILCGFRIFDLTTMLRSPDASAIGETWFDLFDHTLSRGVDITMTLSDFDPIVGEMYHRKSWQSAAQLAGVDEVSGRGKLTFRIANHPARVGLIPRLFLKKKVREKFLDATPDQHTPGLNHVSASDMFEISPATHHQKLAVFDSTQLYIGGLDLDERRYDTPDHARAADQTWADVQAIVTGPVVAAAEAHLRGFEAATEGTAPPTPSHPGFLRTLSARRQTGLFHIAPRQICDEIETAHLSAIARAKDLIYLETQFFRHLPLAEALVAAATQNPSLCLMLVLPAAPEDVAFLNNTGQDARMGEALQTRAIDMVYDAFGPRALVAAPAQRRSAAPQTSGADTVANAPIVYVHSKVSVFDTQEAILSSANLNGRSMRWDTEAGLHLTKPPHVTHLRERLIAHWFPGLTATGSLYDSCRAQVLAAADTAPEARATFLVPYDPTRARAFGQDIPLVPNELV